MRLIGQLHNELEAIQFSHLLDSKQIKHQIEIEKKVDWGDASYGDVECHVWILEEEQVDKAIDALQKFKETARYHPPEPPPLASEKASEPQQSKLRQEVASEISKWEKTPMGDITKFILAVCIIIFFATIFTSPRIPFSQNIPYSTPVYSSPIEKELLYDYPAAYQLIDRLISLYGYEGIESPSTLPTEGRYLVQKINETPYWQGLYTYTLEHRLSTISQIPLFEKIRAGELWRLFTPCLLHGGLLHLFFNMMWLAIVGKQLEERLSRSRYLFFILLTGVVSNTAQYLMSGPDFIGFSGVLTGMIGFIWIRQREAPWESYQLDRLTTMFVAAFIGGIAFLQLIGFLSEYFLHTPISIGIANTAHLIGAATGILLGKTEFYNWK